MASSGSCCALWYRLCSVAQVLINRSTGLVQLWFSWQDRARKLGHSRSKSEKQNIEARLDVIGSDRCVWPNPIWEHHQDYNGGWFCRVDPPMWELHWRKLNKTLVYETDAHWSHRAMKMWWRGPIRGNGMLGYQWHQWLIDPTIGFWFMSSCKSHENVIQGHLVTLGPGAKNQMEQQDCMSLALIGVHSNAKLIMQMMKIGIIA